MTAQSRKSVHLVGDMPVRIYGLELHDWQHRNWGRAGDDKAVGQIYASAHWVLSTGLANAIATQPGAALIASTRAGQRLIAAHATDSANADAINGLIAAPTASNDQIAALGLKPMEASELAGAYNEALRKREVPFAIDLETQGVRFAEKALFKSSYKGVTDFVTKYAWPVPAFHVTRFCAARQISPNSVTTVSLLFVLLAMWFFWHGEWALGIICAWLMTFLDTVDGKLARTTLTSSKWGNIYDHGIDLIHPPFWYWAWLVGIKATETDVPVWLDTAFIIIIAGYILGRAIEGIFMRAHGFHSHMWQKPDSIMRVYIARRNPNTVIFMIFCILGEPALGFGAVAAWTFFCTAFQLVRIIQSGVRPANPPLTSWMES